MVEHQAVNLNYFGSSPKWPSIEYGPCSSPVERLVEAQRRRKFNSSPGHQNKKGDIMNKRWLLKERKTEKGNPEYDLIDTKLNITVQMCLTNWMLIDIFRTVGGFDKVQLDETVNEKELMEYLEWEKERGYSFY